MRQTTWTSFCLFLPTTPLRVLIPVIWIIPKKKMRLHGGFDSIVNLDIQTPEADNANRTDAKDNEIMFLVFNFPQLTDILSKLLEFCANMYCKCFEILKILAVHLVRLQFYLSMAYYLLCINLNSYLTI